MTTKEKYVSPLKTAGLNVVTCSPQKDPISIPIAAKIETLVQACEEKRCRFSEFVLTKEDYDLLKPHDITINLRMGKPTANVSTATVPKDVPAPPITTWKGPISVRLETSEENSYLVGINLADNASVFFTVKTPVEAEV